MLDKLLQGDDDETTLFRRCKKLPHQPHHQIGMTEKETEWRKKGWQLF